MATVNENSVQTSPPVQQQIELTTSSLAQPHVSIGSQPQHPSRHLIENQKRYLDQCVPLYKEGLKGDWKTAKAMLDRENELVNSAITKDWGTLLHVVAGTKHVHFVEELVELLDPCDLELQNSNENTALCLAAASGNLQNAIIMINKNGCLPRIRGAERKTPLYMAAFSGRSDMAKYLYGQTHVDLEEEDGNELFFLCINSDLFELALQMLQTRSTLAFIRNENNQTGLHVLARKPSGLNTTRMPQPSPFVQLVGSLWDILSKHGCSETLRTTINFPSQIAFDATEMGNFHFVAEIMSFDPDLIWDLDVKKRSIIHVAVLHRHSNIFSLIYELRSFKDFIVSLEDDDGNNLLHYAAKLAPPRHLNLISGEALQLTHELLWFQEVKKLMLPSDTEKKNCNGKTPGELFEEEHKELLTKAVSWTESTAYNCMLISTLISTGVLTATFNMPGGQNKTSGTPNYLQKSAFLIFAISDATALISSSVSLLIFLSIVISSYAEYEYFKSMPLMLLYGLIAQIISITSMMLAFSVSFFITYYHYHGFVWAPHFISVLAFLPIPLFKCLLLPLWSDIIHSSHFCMSLFQPKKHMLN